MNFADSSAQRFKRSSCSLTSRELLHDLQKFTSGVENCWDSCIRCAFLNCSLSCSYLKVNLGESLSQRHTTTQTVTTWAWATPLDPCALHVSPAAPPKVWLVLDDALSGTVADDCQFANSIERLLEVWKIQSSKKSKALYALPGWALCPRPDTGALLGALLHTY
jgi:hypothetical protein